MMAIGSPTCLAEILHAWRMSFTFRRDSLRKLLARYREGKHCTKALAAALLAETEETLACLRSSDADYWVKV